MQYKPYSDFENLVGRMLHKLGFTVTPVSNSGTPDTGLDMIAAQGQEKIGIQIRFYRAPRVSESILKNAIRTLRNGMAHAGLERGVLVTTSHIGNSTPSHPPFLITVWDRTKLLKVATEHPEFYDELISLLEIGASELPETLASSGVASGPISLEPFFEPDPEPTSRAKELSEDLRKLPFGRESAQAFEDLGTEIFKYLFENDLAGWLTQATTSDDLNRYDCVCRIKGVSLFWEFILHNINSRYLVLEFKNYSSEIDQGQVLTTEKYLYRNGLRTFAIICARKGASSSAIKMAQGAMRENGKLILILSDENLQEMLKLKETGREPSDYLFDLVDEFLMKLPR
ncbi:restriction endonuclease [Pseudomonas sp. SLBN-26]|uniref:restriction endonuclease n=1 Tax=Pseudomonadaceae TaxID=135621 RepID=UPI0011522F55|nr:MULTISPECIES: restriction endonuclease [Pseudomonas]MCP1617034.1 hypothetical protein [Pseudomonas otitidis]TQL06278.1 restriction endonuclease [Pseudomonas sp. SLBN-26]